MSKNKNALATPILAVLLLALFLFGALLAYLCLQGQLTKASSLLEEATEIVEQQKKENAALSAANTSLKTDNTALGTALKAEAALSRQLAVRIDSLLRELALRDSIILKLDNSLLAKMAENRQLRIRNSDIAEASSVALTKARAQHQAELNEMLILSQQQAGQINGLTAEVEAYHQAASFENPFTVLKEFLGLVPAAPGNSEPKNVANSSANEADTPREKPESLQQKTIHKLGVTKYVALLFSLLFMTPVFGTLLHGLKMRFFS